MKKILVVGASSGIGESLVNILDELGHSVIGTYNQNEPDSALDFRQYDVLDEQADFGELPSVLDGLVYCPGSINLKPFHRISPKSFLEDYELQVVGAIKTIQKVLPHLKQSENPSILLFSTVAVQKGYPFHAQVAASKGAIEGLTRSLAAEFAPKIRMNCIAPSLTDTPLASKLLSSEEKRQSNSERHPLNRIGRPEDLAEMAAFLLSEKSNWITGQIFHVDGGMSAT